MKKMMKPKRAAWMLLLLALMANSLQAQNAAPAQIVQGNVTSATDGMEIIGASVCEVDANNRVVTTGLVYRGSTNKEKLNNSHFC